MSWHIYPITRFADYRERWQALHTGRATPPLHDLAFITPLLRIFGSGNESLACYVVDDKVQAMAILHSKGMGRWETFQPSQSPLGLWIQGQGTIEAPLISELRRTLPGFPLALAITQQDPDLVSRPTDEGGIKTLDYIQTARVLVQGSFDDYWQARSKKLRQNLKRQRSNLSKAGVTTRLEKITTPEDVAAAIADFGRLESLGWKGKSGTAVHADNQQGAFYREVLEGFCQKGAGHIYRYWYNDNIAAMNLCIEGNGTLVSLKIAYDESIANHTSPALLMRQEVFERIFNEGKLKKIEFYGKGQTIWTDHVRTLYHVNSYRWPSAWNWYRSLIKPAALQTYPE